MEKVKLLSPKDALTLELLVSLPEGEPVGVVQIVHGMCEHKERYQEFMEYLNKEGYIAVIHDHRGHGKSVRSEDDLGYMYGAGAEGLLADTRRVTGYIKKRFPGLPLILFGHSMGSLIARVYLKQYDADIDYLVVCGPPSENPAVDVGIGLARLIKAVKGKRYRSRLLETIVFGAYAAKFSKEKSKFAWICSREEIVEAYDKSPLCGFTFTIDGYLALFSLLKETYSQKGWKRQNLSLPILFIGGEDDPCIGGLKKFQKAASHLRNLGYHKIRGHLYEGMRHEILNETERLKVFEDVSCRLREELTKDEK